MAQSDWELIVFISLVQVELDGAWVCVSVLDSPLAGLTLHVLEGLGGQVHETTGHAKFRLGLRLSGLVIKKTKNRDTTDAPLTWRVRHVVDGHNEAGQFVLDKGSSTIAHCATERAVKHAWVT